MNGVISSTVESIKMAKVVIYAGRESTDEAICGALSETWHSSVDFSGTVARILW